MGGQEKGIWWVAHPYEAVLIFRVAVPSRVSKGRTVLGGFSRFATQWTGSTRF